MKKYISASGSSSDAKLVSALIAVIWSAFDMGDSLSDIVEGFADQGGIDLPDEYNADEMLKSVLKQLVAQRSAAIPESFIYYFTEYPNILLDEISTDSPSGKDSKLYKAIQTIYDRIGEFPGGDSVKTAIEENIFNSERVEGNAAEVGYAIGLEYWRYIKSKEYGVRSNTASALGVSIGCREAIGGKYKYAFMQDISSYYYKDLYKQHSGMPSATGYMVKFYNQGNTVFADIFNLFQVPSSTPGVVTWDIDDAPVYTFDFSEYFGDDAVVRYDSAVETVSKAIAAWLDAHVEDAIESALEYKG